MVDVMLIDDTLDKRIRANLRQGEATASDLSRSLPYPRTTLTYRLARLHTLKLVDFRAMGRRKLWRLSARPQQKKDLIQIFSGRDFYECYKAFLHTPARTTVYAIQGGRSGKAILASTPSYFLREVHALFNRRKIVIRSVVHRDLIGAFAGMGERLLRSHQNRPQIHKIVDGPLLAGGGELLVSPHALLLTHAQKQRALLVKDKEIVRVCYDTLTLLHNLGEHLPNASYPR